ncbi:MAG: peptidoglycan bridge formation glycyltransferase FemA/FemB family protein [Spirochaetaceae bacterium]|nr:peptidoglycan bridge formation glycyltransferase FemA/FemB family protein [Spirochaetaceae bacterium]
MFLKQLIPCPPAEALVPASFLQSSFWGNFKGAFGWKAQHFKALWNKPEFAAGETCDNGNNGENVNENQALLLISRPLKFGIEFAYVPWGPQLPQEYFGNDLAQNGALSELTSALKPFLSKKTAFIRYDPPWFGTETTPTPVISKPFVHAAADIQPPDTVLLDIIPDSDAILAQMKPKWRYNIRLGGKKVNVRRAGKDELPVYYQIFKETSLRDGIAIHGIDYYTTLFDLAEKTCAESAEPAPDVRLYLAEYEGIAIAGIITLFYGKTATYLYGASSNQHRNLMAPYALQWQAILDAKTSGCTTYDFFGIPPNDNPSHPMAGLYRFKTGFGGTIIHRPGSFDYPYKPLTSTLFHFAEQLRKHLRDRKKTH